MEKEEKNMGVLGALSLVSFVVAIVAWFMTIECVQSDWNLLHEIHKITCYIGVSDFHKTMEIVALMWGVSVWYKLWIISAVVSTALLWPCGGFLSLIMTIIAFFLAFVSTILPLGTVQIDTGV